MKLEDELINTPPYPLKKKYLDWSKVVAMAGEFVETGAYDDEYDPQYLFEEVINTVYGTDIWKFINSRGRD